MSPGPRTRATPPWRCARKRCSMIPLPLASLPAAKVVFRPSPIYPRRRELTSGRSGSTGFGRKPWSRALPIISSTRPTRAIPSAPRRPRSSRPPARSRAVRRPPLPSAAWTWASTTPTPTSRPPTTSACGSPPGRGPSPMPPTQLLPSLKPRPPSTAQTPISAAKAPRAAGSWKRPSCPGTRRRKPWPWPTPPAPSTSRDAISTV